MLYRLGAKLLKVDNRKMLGFALLCTVLGSFLCGDWQAMANDPCTSASPSNSSYNDSFSQGADNVSIYEDIVKHCEAMSSSENHCFWNPQSRITGEFCNTCYPACLSEQRALNFYQFALGALLITLAGSIGHVFMSAVTSDISPIESQVRYTLLHLSRMTFSECIFTFRGSL